LNFIEDLKKITETPIILIDERMSTVSASRSLREAGLDSKKSKSIIDMAAAVAILEFAITIEKGKS
jgi:putative Holliday junction resolvase